jgi:hypothetical protein
MRKAATIFFVLSAYLAVAADTDESGRIARMSETLQKGGIEKFMEAVREARWPAPRMPSKWFVDGLKEDDAEKRLLQAARDLGSQLAVQLDVCAQEQQMLPPGGGLFHRTQLICDVGDWCAGTAGYGNVFLARRCLDLGAVGLARLTASLDFPITDCEKLVARMAPEWMGMAYRLRVLNGEAGTNLFVNAGLTNEELDWQWAIGWTMRKNAERGLPNGKKDSPNPAFVNVAAFTNNIGFFTSYELPPKPITLSRSWGSRQHRLIAMGLELQSVNKALAFWEYRSIVGFFPEKFIRSEEERLQLERDIKEAAKWGTKITPMENDPSFDPIKESFRRAWLARAGRDKEKDNYYVFAVQSYHETKEGRFYDRDTAQIRSNEPMSSWQKARFDAEQKEAAEAFKRYKEFQAKP